jgi:bacillithiol biosynthesis deacetylase BshB1
VQDGMSEDYEKNDSIKTNPKLQHKRMKLDILVFGSHPDDAELGAGATIAKEVAAGKRVGIVDLTRGELGTRGTPEIRDKEALKAAKILGLATRENLEFADGFFTNDMNHKMAVIRILRKFRPDIVLCNAIEDRHIDHAKGSKLVSDACFLSGLIKIDTKFEGDDQWQEAWRPKKVYHYIQWKPIEPDFVVDVTGFIDKKLEAISAYSSQFYDPKSSEPQTPISSKNFTDSVEYRARDLGRLVGVEHAEGFTVERYLAVSHLDSLI